MTPSGASGGATAAAPSEFSERLYVPWWGWPLPLLAAVLLAAEIHMGFPGVRSWLPYLVTVPLVVALLVRFGRLTVAVRGDELHVGDAHLPLALVGAVEVLDAKSKRPALGRELDPLAFVAHRGWVGPALRVEVTDPDDPTPYWLFSTRRPDELADLLRRRRPQR